MNQTIHHNNTRPVPGLYEHYKGQQYKVIGVGRHTETLEEYVLYQALYGNYDYWIRPLTMFCEDIEYNGITRPRFILIKTER